MYITFYKDYLDKEFASGYNTEIAWFKHFDLQYKLCLFY